MEWIYGNIQISMPAVQMTAQYPTTGFSIGTTIRLSLAQNPAPSIAAASKISSSIAARPAR